VAALAAVFAVATPSGPAAAEDPCGSRFVVEYAGNELQDTLDSYGDTGAFWVAVTQPGNARQFQEWWRRKLWDGNYQFVNVATGRALQQTNETTNGSFNVVTSPAEWGIPEQEWRIEGKWWPGQQIRNAVSGATLRATDDNYRYASWWHPVVADPNVRLDDNAYDWTVIPVCSPYGGY
jgi:hypothetical protein